MFQVDLKKKCSFGPGGWLFFCRGRKYSYTVWGCERQMLISDVKTVIHVVLSDANTVFFAVVYYSNSRLKGK